MTANTISVTPAAAKLSTWCRIMGRFPNSTRGFGSVKVYSTSVMSKRITSRTGAFFGAGGAYQRPQTGAKSSDKNKSYTHIDISNGF